MQSSKTQKTFKTTTLFTTIGSILLLVMAAFHGSGFFYVREAITSSNAEDFLKDIVPALFAHPSIHLMGLSALGLLTLWLRHEAYKVAWLLAALIALDAVLAFYLGGCIPGLLLLLAAACFVLSGGKSKNMPSA
ncbi:hypothetical protein [Maribacter sp. 2307UL18-2]|uniref:hypothetical protein n=1 Tax=Maribacter sp. 2307UL18-2 TaxID=3386274 RepID=UPI0039BCB8F7